MTVAGTSDTPSPDDNIPSRLSRRSRTRRWFIAFSGLLGSTLLGWFGLKTWTRTGIPVDAPRIGASLDTAWHARLGISTANYEVAVARVGAHLEGVRSTDVDPEEFLDRIDGLLLTGGGDVDPRLYDGPTNTAVLVDRKRDDFETALYHGAVRRRMPVLGICRGIQLINVIHGGSLKDLRHDPLLSSRHGVGVSSMTAHSVDISQDTRLAAILGSGPQDVNSFHGQAVDRVGDGLKVVARADDGLIEALERPGDMFVVCTQWHPEVPPQQISVFSRFLDAVRHYRRTRRTIHDASPG